MSAVVANQSLCKQNIAVKIKLADDGNNQHSGVTGCPVSLAQT